MCYHLPVHEIGSSGFVTIRLLLKDFTNNRLRHSRNGDGWIKRETEANSDSVQNESNILTKVGHGVHDRGDNMGVICWNACNSVATWAYMVHLVFCWVLRGWRPVWDQPQSKCIFLRHILRQRRKTKGLADLTIKIDIGQYLQSLQLLI